MSPLQKKRLLIAEREVTTREVLKNFLSRYFDVDVVASAQEVLREVREKHYDLLLADFALALTDSVLLPSLRREMPRLKIALASKAPVESHFMLLRQFRIYTVIPKMVPFNFDEFLLSIENLLSPERAFGLGRYLRNPMQVRNGLIHTRQDRATVVDDSLAFFRRFRSSEHDLGEIRLAFEELINNAVYHAFRRHGGAEKYRVGEFKNLDGSERVQVEYGHDPHYLGVSVSDNQGSIDVDTVLSKIERQITDEGLLDESGRGLYLTRTLADRMIVNVEPGAITQVVLLFSHRRLPQVKPIYFNIMG